MKKFLPLLLILWACQTSNSEKSNEALEKDNPIQWLNYKAKNNAKDKHIVLVSGDEEYRSEEALPQLAKILNQHHGFNCTVLFAQDPANPGIIDPNYAKNIPGLDQLEEAELLILFTRFRALPDTQMQHFKNYFLQGKPIIGIRTATHAFDFKDSTSNWIHWGNYYDKKGSGWEGGFGRKVLGTNWHTHHGQHKHQSTRGILASGATSHPLTQGIRNGVIWGPTDVYGLPLPLPLDIYPFVLGEVVNRAGEFDENDLFFGMKSTDRERAIRNPANEQSYHPNDPMMPIVWMKPYQLPEGKKGFAITSTIGSSTDMLNEELRRLFVNATYFLLELPVPEEAEVDLIGNYRPTQFNFHTDEYWDEKQLKVTDFLE